MTSNFRVLGAGVWGLAFSDYLLKLGHNVEIFCRDTNLSNRDIKGLALSHISNNNIIANSNHYYLKFRKFKLWRPLRESNPCFRRERAAS